ncbi:hypothetical protein [Pontibacter sp. SGAir0037]|uniref:hypothetical protein n=1 Tax=Pontibacter sp. SGAir0037 TaxID=2571030 RepID=UPI0010CD3405|nr:hypothetical protein [Pontibacter sp. SGAir0037]QCR24745.1 hypothetical protein C1N53_21905 [Pontibacter sp. SGAir0037]
MDMNFYVSNINSASQAVLNYKPHPLALYKAGLLPQSLARKYFIDESPIFKYITLQKYNLYFLPAFSASIDKLLKDNDTIPIAYMLRYQEGFFKGYGSSLIPFIDTPDNRRDAVIQIVLQKDYGFIPNGLAQPGSRFEHKYSLNEFYSYGVEVGISYKAWGILLENISLFENAFTSEVEKQVSNQFQYLGNRQIITVDESMMNKPLLTIQIAPTADKVISPTGPAVSDSINCAIARHKKQPDGKPKQMAIALYYYYLHRTGESLIFDEMEGGKINGIKTEAERWNVSWKALQTKYNSISMTGGKRIRTASNMKNHIKAAIELLFKNPHELSDVNAALALAKDELKIAELSNPLT